jgi:4-hydroxythreonine-4-phosphate dehydrogenase
MDDRPLIAVTLGDPAGIGPEIVVKSLVQERILQSSRPVIIGSAASLQAANEQVGSSLVINQVSDPRDVQGKAGVLDLIEPIPLHPGDVEMGKVSATCGKAAVAYIERGIDLAAAGQVAAMVTCPIHKEAIQLVGHEGDIGHQEMLARKTGSADLAVMLMTEGLKVVHLSTHKPLRDAVAYVKHPVIVQRLKLTAATVSKWGMRKPKIAVAALNPHGGESGLLGREEIEEIGPAIVEANGLGIDVEGPYPADSIFYRAINGEFDIVLALYHDQGHIPIKVHDFEDSVTATMGIPFIRTSVDHGTAFDIVGKNEANPRSLIRAVQTAVDMVRGDFS